MYVRATLSICLALVAQSRNPSTSTADVIEAATSYVAKYEQQLTSVVAMEVSTQRVLRRVPAEADATATRALTSEMFFIFSPAEHEWMAVRDVHEVDGKPVENPPDLQKTMMAGPLLQGARALKNYSSRYNLGSIVRNFGEPTLSLLVLDANHRSNFTFARTTTERKSGVTLVTVYFREHGTATLIHDISGAPVLSQGELVIEAGAGRIRHAVLKAQMGGIWAELTTTYQPDAKLDMWVPSSFSEQYDDDRRVESIRCEATYSNFRRFEAFGRIK